LNCANYIFFIKSHWIEINTIIEVKRERSKPSYPSFLLLPLRGCLNLVFSTESYQCLAVGQATQPRRRGILFLYSLQNHGKNPFLSSFLAKKTSLRLKEKDIINSHWHISKWVH
jgi:hypothetical protein